MNQQAGGDVDCRWNHIVAGLAAVDVIVGMRLREVADYLVGVHVGGCSAAGLEDIDDELIIVPSGGDFVSGLLDGGGQILRQLARAAVDSRGGAFDQTESSDEGALETQAADREILDRTLRLRAIQSLGGDLHFAHGVALGAVVHGYGIVFLPLVSYISTGPNFSSTGLIFAPSPTATIWRASVSTYLRATRCTCSAVTFMILAG